MPRGENERDLVDQVSTSGVHAFVSDIGPIPNEYPMSLPTQVYSNRMKMYAEKAREVEDAILYITGQIQSFNRVGYNYQVNDQTYTVKQVCDKVNAAIKISNDPTFDFDDQTSIGDSIDNVPLNANSRVITDGSQVTRVYTWLGAYNKSFPIHYIGQAKYVTTTPKNENPDESDAKLYRPTETNQHRNHTFRGAHHTNPALYMHDYTPQDEGIANCKTAMQYADSLIPDEVEKVYVTASLNVKWNAVTEAMLANVWIINFIYPGQTPYAHDRVVNVQIVPWQGLSTEFRAIRMLPFFFGRPTRTYTAIGGRKQPPLIVSDNAGCVTSINDVSHCPAYMDNATGKGAVWRSYALSWYNCMSKVAWVYGTDEGFFGIVPSCLMFDRGKGKKYKEWRNFTTVLMPENTIYGNIGRITGSTPLETWHNSRPMVSTDNYVLNNTRVPYPLISIIENEDNMSRKKDKLLEIMSSHNCNSLIVNPDSDDLENDRACTIYTRGKGGPVNSRTILMTLPFKNINHMIIAALTKPGHQVKVNGLTHLQHNKWVSNITNKEGWLQFQSLERAWAEALCSYKDNVLPQNVFEEMLYGDVAMFSNKTNPLGLQGLDSWVIMETKEILKDGKVNKLEQKFPCDPPPQCTEALPTATDNRSRNMIYNLLRAGCTVKIRNLNGKKPRKAVVEKVKFAQHVYARIQPDRLYLSELLKAYMSPLPDKFMIEEAEPPLQAIDWNPLLIKTGDNQHYCPLTGYNITHTFAANYDGVITPDRTQWMYDTEGDVVLPEYRQAMSALGLAGEKRSRTEQQTYEKQAVSGWAIGLPVGHGKTTIAHQARFKRTVVDHDDLLDSKIVQINNQKAQWGEIIREDDEVTQQARVDALSYLRNVHPKEGSLLLTWGPATTPKNFHFIGYVVLADEPTLPTATESERQRAKLAHHNYQDALYQDDYPVKICGDYDAIMNYITEVIGQMHSGNWQYPVRQNRNIETLMLHTISEQPTIAFSGQPESNPMTPLYGAFQAPALSHSDNHTPELFQKYDVVPIEKYSFWEDEMLHIVKQIQPLTKEARRTIKTDERPMGVRVITKKTMEDYPSRAYPIIKQMVYSEQNAVAAVLGSRIEYRKHKLDPVHEVTELAKTYFRSDWRELVTQNKEKPITLSTSRTIQWLRERTGIASIDTELDNIEREGLLTNPTNRLNVHVKLESLLKNTTINNYAEAQARIIVWQQKGICALFADCFLEAKERLKELLRPEIVYADGLTPDELSANVKSVDNAKYILEDDLAKQDRQTDWDILECEMTAYTSLLGVAPNVVSLWKSAHKNWHFRGTFIKGTLDAMRHTGQATTALGNVITNLLVHRRMAKHLGTGLKRMFVLGDDNLTLSSKMINREKLRKDIKDYYNMDSTCEVKRNNGIFLRMICFKDRNGKWGFGPDYIRLRHRYSVTNNDKEATSEIMKQRAASYMVMLGDLPETRHVRAHHALDTKIFNWYDVETCKYAVAEHYGVSYHEVECNISDLYRMMLQLQPRKYKFEVFTAETKRYGNNTTADTPPRTQTSISYMHTKRHNTPMWSPNFRSNSRVAICLTDNFNNPNVFNVTKERGTPTDWMRHGCPEVYEQRTDGTWVKHVNTIGENSLKYEPQATSLKLTMEALARKTKCNWKRKTIPKLTSIPDQIGAITGHRKSKWLYAAGNETNATTDAERAWLFVQGYIQLQPERIGELLEKLQRLPDVKLITQPENLLMDWDFKCCIATGDNSGFTPLAHDRNGVYNLSMNALGKPSLGYIRKAHHWQPLVLPVISCSGHPSSMSWPDHWHTWLGSTSEEFFSALQVGPNSEYDLQAYYKMIQANYRHEHTYRPQALTDGIWHTCACGAKSKLNVCSFCDMNVVKNGSSFGSTIKPTKEIRKQLQDWDIL
jgi:hypothetical protein